MPKVTIAIIMILILQAPYSERYVEAGTKIPTITIHAKRYEFRPSEITLKQGQKVKLIFVADDVAHGVTVTELKLDVNIEKNSPAQTILTPLDVGDFEGRCSRYCGAGHSAMRFRIHVTH